MEKIKKEKETQPFKFNILDKKGKWSKWIKY